MLRIGLVYMYMYFYYTLATLSTFPETAENDWLFSSQRPGKPTMISMKNNFNNFVLSIVFPCGYHLEWVMALIL